MALPQEHSYILNYLRTSFLKSYDDGISDRVIKPYLDPQTIDSTNDNNQDYGNHIFNGLADLPENLAQLYKRSNSPPIQRDLFSDVKERKKNNRDLTTHSKIEEHEDEDEDVHSFMNNTAKASTGLTNNTNNTNNDNGNDNTLKKPDSNSGMLAESLSTMPESIVTPKVSKNPMNIVRLLRKSSDNNKKVKIDNNNTTSESDSDESRLSSIPEGSMISLPSNTANTKTQHSFDTLHHPATSFMPKIDVIEQQNDKIAESYSSSSSDFDNTDEDDDDDDDDDDDSDLDGYDSDFDFERAAQGMKMFKGSNDDYSIYSSTGGASKNQQPNTLLLNGNGGGIGKRKNLNNSLHDKKSRSKSSLKTESKIQFKKLPVSVYDENNNNSTISNHSNNSITGSNNSFSIKSNSSKLIKIKSSSSQIKLIANNLDSNLNDDYENSYNPDESNFDSINLQQQQQNPIIRSRKNTGQSFSSNNTSSSKLSIGSLEVPSSLTNSPNLHNNYKQQNKNLKSNLTDLIQAKNQGDHEPLEQFISASGEGHPTPLTIKMFMPTCDEPKKPWSIVVRPDALVVDTIGYALYKYTKENRKPELNEKLMDANRWTLRIIEEDGEPDEDFPALDRRRNVSKYSFDEFALVESSESQYKQNEKLTPNIKQQTNENSNTTTTNNNVPTTLLPGEIINSKRVSSNRQTVRLKIFEYPFEESTSMTHTALWFKLDTTLNEVIEKTCSVKRLNPNEYSLRIAGQSLILDKFQQVEYLGGEYNLELIPNKVIKQLNNNSTTTYNYSLATPSASGLKNQAMLDNQVSPTYDNNSDDIQEAPPTVKKSSRSRKYQQQQQSSVTMISNHLSSSHKPFHLPSSLKGKINNTNNNKFDKFHLSDIPPDSLNGTAFQKWFVWRRQQMSFISRHERILAIDGDYVYIMPSDDKTWFDSPKTSSFHINQIIKIKISKKLSSNLKIVVRKTNGPKRYDLEAMNSKQANEIVSKLKALVTAYRLNNHS